MLLYRHSLQESLIIFHFVLEIGAYDIYPPPSCYNRFILSLLFQLTKKNFLVQINRNCARLGNDLARQIYSFFQTSSRVTANQADSVSQQSGLGTRHTCGIPVPILPGSQTAALTL